MYKGKDEDKGSNEERNRLKQERVKQEQKIEELQEQIKKMKELAMNFMKDQENKQPMGGGFRDLEKQLQEAQKAKINKPSQEPAPSQPASRQKAEAASTPPPAQTESLEIKIRKLEADINTMAMKMDKIIFDAKAQGLKGQPNEVTALMQQIDTKGKQLNILKLAFFEQRVATTTIQAIDLESSTNIFKKRDKTTQEPNVANVIKQMSAAIIQYIQAEIPLSSNDATTKLLQDTISLVTKLTNAAYPPQAQSKSSNEPQSWFSNLGFFEEAPKPKVDTAKVDPLAVYINAVSNVIDSAIKRAPELGLSLTNLNNILNIANPNPSPGPAPRLGK
jgi:hypothetical protein